MSLEYSVVYDLIKCSCEIKWDGVKIPLLSFSEEVLDAYIYYVEQTGTK